MAWLAVDMDKAEFIYDEYPERGDGVFDPDIKCNFAELPKGTIKNF